MLQLNAVMLQLNAVMLQLNAVMLQPGIGSLLALADVFGALPLALFPYREAC